jgi:hypothetical protein
MIYFGEGSMIFWEECILCSCRIDYSIDISQVHLIYVSFNSKVPLVFFVWMTYILEIEEYWSPPLSLCCSLSVPLNPVVYVWLKLGASTLDAYNGTIVISYLFWGAISLVNIFHPFTLSQCFLMLTVIL